ncbi:hypothetical protein WR25_05072 [Diploscapter pachys]|uniref:ShKT domain-containing protein n=1 Tax=Diploscapter pachys TaxID=2018661 RepID=A0A2A2L078_9BILA|nr:hypothetical protein WR25_05072 [Diploscapter pachys]
MTDQCPKTCGRCDVSTTTTASITCVDKLNPKTGVSERCDVSTTTTASITCVDKLNPKTGVSERCDVSTTITTSSTCVDKLNPKTGISGRCGVSTTTTASIICVDKLNPKTGVSGRCGVSTTTTASITCVDKLNPTTGVSGRCGVSTTTTASITCVDKLNPTTGVSDCPGMASYCNDTAYYNLMTDQCPKTCGRCGVSTTTTASITCVDKLNPTTGVSDCPGMASYCNDTAYYDLMTDQCPKTCGRCGASGTTSAGSQATAGSTCVDKLNPNTGVSDCPSRVS